MPAIERSRDRAITAVLFDMDNTFFDLIEAKMAACRAVTGWFGQGDGETLFGYFCRPVLDFEHYGHLRDFLGDHGVRDPALLGECIDCYRSSLLAALEPYPGVADTLQRIRTQGLKTGVVTDAYRRDAQDRLRAADMDDLFDCVVAYETTLERKPSPAPFTAALASLGVGPAQAVFVGDSLHRDILPAQRLGFTTVHAAYGDRNIGEQPAVTPDVRIDGMAELVAVLEELQQSPSSTHRPRVAARRP
jgi:putative hydrolase of the HAD superfamily